MKPIYNKQKEVLTRYTFKDFKNIEWDNLYSHIPAYKFVTNLQDGGRSYGKRVILRVPLTQEWLDEKENSGSGYKCLKCKDQGINRTENDFCSCELGEMAKQKFPKENLT